MTLIEALKTGRPIRRAGDTAYIQPEMFDGFYCPLSREFMLAEDWEVEPTPVPVTREQFEEAWIKAIATTSIQHMHQVLIKELGL